jgi:vanillate O-demethylase monooxygenase subunit
MFVRNAWYLAAWADEISDRPLARRICNEPVVFFRDHENRVAALENRCCHRGAPLHIGQVVEQGIQCGYHGLIYDRSGTCVFMPRVTSIPAAARVRSYPVVEKNKIAWIWMGDAARADESKIIDYPFHDDSERWPHKHATMPVKANYMRLVDNLVDSTHIAYVHRSTIGGNPEAFANAKETVTRTPLGVKLSRWMLNSTAPATYIKAVGFKGKIDRWIEFEFIAPGTVMLWTGALDAGAGAYELNKREGGFSLRNFNCLTPETESSCHYFWSVANNYRQNEPEATQQVFDEVMTAFLEDKAVIEAQQTTLSEFGETRLISIPSDVARVHAQRAVDQMLANEAGEPAVARTL